LVGRPEGRRLLATARPRWKDIKICIREINLGMKIEFMWLRVGTLVNILMHLRVP
jgi:hypothetical protein